MAHDTARWDPGFAERLVSAAEPIAKLWFRFEVREESQLFPTRGTWLAKRLGLSRWRSNILPVTLGFPFGLSVILPPNLPLPTKIVTEVGEPINPASFGAQPSVTDIDAHVRSTMQTTLDRLARARRFPVLG